MADRVAEQLAGEPSAAPDRMGAIFGALANTWPARLGKSIAGAVTLPGDAYQGNVPVVGEDGRTNPAVIDRSAELAALTMLGATGAPRGAIGNGPAGMFKWSPLDNADVYRELALKQRNNGGGGTVRVFNTQEALDASRGKLSPWEQALAEAKHGVKSARDEAGAGFRDAAVENPLLKDPHYELGYRPSSTAEAFTNASGARDVLGLSDGRTLADLIRMGLVRDR